MKGARIAFTIIARNYCHYAALLAESYIRNHPEDHFYIIFIDNNKIPVENADSYNINEILPEELLHNLAFRYDLLEFSTAVKPSVFLWLTKMKKPEQILYIDPDIYIYKPLSVVIQNLKESDCVLIPHITTPYTDNHIPSEQEIIASGLYNLGFAGFSVNKNTLLFWIWWETKLRTYGYADPENHIFTDQKWMDLAPCYLNAYIMKEKGYDVAYWNLHEYINSFEPEEVVFFHFSGLTDNQYISKYQDRFTYADIGSYKKLFDEYRTKLEESTYTTKGFTNPYSSFDNGVTITYAIRTAYRYLVDYAGKSYKNPFTTKGKQSLFSGLLQEDPKTGVLNLYSTLYNADSYLRQLFPYVNWNQMNEELRQYISWLTPPNNRYEIPYQFVDKQRSLLKESMFALPSTESLEAKLSYLVSIKDNSSTPFFVKTAYKLLLLREAEQPAIEKNVTEIDEGTVSRDLFILRLLKSGELKKTYNLSSTDIWRYALPFAGNALWKKGKDAVSGKKPTSHSSTVSMSHPTEPEWGINISGYIDTESGLGEHTRGLIRGIEEAHIPFTLQNVRQKRLRMMNKEYTSFTNNNSYPINLICINADQLTHVIQTQLGEEYLRGKYTIGNWAWESDILPEEYHSAFSYLDEVWCATDYVYNAIQRVSPVPVYKIPPALHPDESVSIFDFSRYHSEQKVFRFLTVFDAQSYPERKNVLGAIDAFISFKKRYNHPHARLIIKSSNLSTMPETENKVRDAITKHPDIVLIDTYLEQSEIRSLIKSSNAYLSLHRSEGLGLPIVEAMQYKVPVIVTGFSANMDFCNVNNSYLVKWNKYVLKKQIGPYPVGTLWADPDPEHAAHLMNEVLTSPATAQMVAQRAYKTVKDEYGVKRIAERIKERVSRIYKQKLCL